MGSLLQVVKEDEELNLNLSEEETRELVRYSEIGQMIGGMAHEINSPLAIVQGFASQIEMMANSSTVDLARLQNASRKIVRTSQRIAKIVKGLKALSRNGVNDPFEYFELSLVVEETIELCRHRFYINSIPLYVDFPPCGKMGYGRPTQVSQVLINLLNNAFDAVYGSTEPWVRVGFQEDNDDFLISVQDSGPLIPSRVKEKLFEASFTTKSAGAGTGIGLSVSSAIAKEHGGSLEYVQNEGRKEFQFKLPRKFRQGITI